VGLGLLAAAPPGENGRSRPGMNAAKRCQTYIPRGQSTYHWSVPPIRAPLR
jgi:hypothetical protein